MRELRVVERGGCSSRRGDVGEDTARGEMKERGVLEDVGVADWMGC